VRISGNFRGRCVLALGLMLLGTTALLADSEIYTFGLVRIDGKPTPLAFYQGKVDTLPNMPGSKLSTRSTKTRA